MPPRPAHARNSKKRGRTPGSSFHLGEDAVSYLVKQPIREQECIEMYAASSLKKRYRKIIQYRYLKTFYSLSEAASC